MNIWTLHSRHPSSRRSECLCITRMYTLTQKGNNEERIMRHCQMYSYWSKTSWYYALSQRIHHPSVPWIEDYMQQSFRYNWLIWYVTDIFKSIMNVCIYTTCNHRSQMCWIGIMLVIFRFDPDRFLNRKLPGFAFEPFGFAGKRQCPANQFSYLEITIVIVNILPRFRFRLVDETPVKGMLSLVTFPERDIMVTVEHRKWGSRRVRWSLDYLWISERHSLL